MGKPQITETPVSACIVWNELHMYPQCIISQLCNDGYMCRYQKGGLTFHTLLQKLCSKATVHVPLGQAKGKAYS